MFSKVRTLATLACAAMAITVAPAPAFASPAFASPALVSASATPPAVGASQVVCTYTLMSWRGGFSANLSISNSGPPIDGWVVRWTFDTPTTITGVWAALMTQNASGVSATNVFYNSRIPTGQAASFGWNGVAAASSVPTDLTVNGRPC